MRILVDCRQIGEALGEERGMERTLVESQRTEEAVGEIGGLTLDSISENIYIISFTVSPSFNNILLSAARGNP